jgi:hypothetical protein
MDDVTTAVTLVALEQPDLAEQWFATIAETYDEVADSDDVWAGFVDRFPDPAASYFGSSTAVAWIEGVQDLTTDPASLLAEMAERRGELAALYWAELETAQAGEATAVSDEGAAWGEEYPAAEAEGADDRFGWVLGQPELVARVEATFQYLPEHYDSHLGPYLDQLWGPGWEQHPDEHKQAWLDQVLAGLEQAATAEPAESAGTGVSGGTGEPVTGDEAQGAGELAEVEQQVADALAEALVEVPEAADLSDEEIAEVLAEVLAEQSSAGGV